MSRSEELITRYSGVSARQTVVALDPKSTPEQVARAALDVRAADRNLERLRTGHIE